MYEYKYKYIQIQIQIYTNTNTNTVSAHQLQKSPGCCTSQLSPAHIACNLTSSSLPVPSKWELLCHLTLMFGWSPKKSKCKWHCLIVLQVTSERKMHSKKIFRIPFLSLFWESPRCKRYWSPIAFRFNANFQRDTCTRGANFRAQ